MEGEFESADVTGSGGVTGSDGVTGSGGVTGSDEITGSDGMTGSDGVTGSDGMTGSDGVTGSDGMTGSDGVTGSDEITGSDGGSSDLSDSRNTILSTEVGIGTTTASTIMVAINRLSQVAPLCTSSNSTESASACCSEVRGGVYWR